MKFREYQNKVDQINEEMLDPMIRDKLNLLNKKKQKLVEIEDFDSAKDIKQIIDKIKIIGAQIAKMEFQKKQSIEAEDFDTSKMLKFEIERLREAAFSFDTDRLLAPMSRPGSKGYQMNPDEVFETEAELNRELKSMRDLQDIEEEMEDEDDVSMINFIFYRPTDPLEL